MAADSNIVVDVGVDEMRMRCDNFAWVSDDRHSSVFVLEQLQCNDTQGLVSNIDGRKL
jgi:hypothetical protein